VIHGALSKGNWILDGNPVDMNFVEFMPNFESYLSTFSYYSRFGHQPTRIKTLIFNVFKIFKNKGKINMNFKELEKTYWREYYQERALQLLIRCGLSLEDARKIYLDQEANTLNFANRYWSMFTNNTKSSGIKVAMKIPELVFSADNQKLQKKMMKAVIEFAKVGDDDQVECQAEVPSTIQFPTKFMRFITNPIKTQISSNYLKVLKDNFADLTTSLNLSEARKKEIKRNAIKKFLSMPEQSKIVQAAGDENSIRIPKEVAEGKKTWRGAIRDDQIEKFITDVQNEANSEKQSNGLSSTSELQ
jgi:hypothetical protein